MGCDIHVSIEAKIGGTWYAYSAPNVRRRYGLFAALAGVRSRSDDEQLFPIRGLPCDAAVVTRARYAEDGSDAHTPSWIGWGDFVTLSQALCEECGELWLDTAIGYLDGGEWGEKMPAWCEDIRMVFWFGG